MDIRTALAQLDPQDDEHWTMDGLPRVDAVAVLSGYDEVTRKEITDAAPGLTRDTPLPVPMPPVAAPTAGTQPQSQQPQASQPAPQVRQPPPLPQVPKVTEDVEDVVGEPVGDPDAVLDMPIGDVLSDYALVRSAIEAIDRKANEKLREKQQIEDELKQLWAKNELLQRAVVRHEQRDPSLRKSQAIRNYLESQHEARAVRASRARRFIDAGTTAADVADQLRGASKLDAAMSKRKPALGARRPAPRPIVG